MGLHPIQQVERSFEELCKMKDSYRPNGEGKKVLVDKKANWFWQGYFPLGRGRGLSGRLSLTNAD